MQRPEPGQPLASATARLSWLRACCAVAEGADVPLPHAAPDASTQRCPPDVCVGAVLGDALRRVAVLGGREGMPRSLGSVFGGAVTLFLGGALRGVVSRAIDTPGVFSLENGVALSVDGGRLLVTDTARDSHAIHEYDCASGTQLRVVGGRAGAAPLHFQLPCQVCVAPDGFVFVAEGANDRVQVLTPALDFHGFLGVGLLRAPAGVCASADVVVVSEPTSHRLSAFRRSSEHGAAVSHIGQHGSGCGDLSGPFGVCCTRDGRRVAVAEYGNDRVSVFSVDGTFVRHVGVGVLRAPEGVACSDFDELVVADSGSRCVRVFSDVGELLKTFGGRTTVVGVAIHRATVFVVQRTSAGADQACVLYA
jgi:DNA-binding beta-propeller fold protein YncE